MKNYSFLNKITTTTIIATLALSCQGNFTRKAEQAKATEQPQSQPNIAYGNLVIKEQSDYLMIPVGQEERNQKRENSLDYSGYSQRDGNLHNIIFYNKENGETHLLLNKKAFINSFDLLETKTVGKPPTRVWLYRIIDQDTNADKKLNNEDAMIGYISDLSGKNLQQVTPNNTKIINWVIVPSQNAIFLKIIKDSDNDKKFTGTDKTNFVRVNLEKPSMGNEIISDQIEKDINSYIK